MTRSVQQYWRQMKGWFVPDRFRDRSEAGQVLAERLCEWHGRSDVLVLALPRGGVPVAYEIATALSVPLDVFLVRKLGVPGHVELAMGALASGGVRVLNADVVEPLRIPERTIDEVAAAELRELERRERAYRGASPAPAVRDKVVIVTDDGLATGSTMRAALTALRQQQPARLIVAVPVGAKVVCDELRDIADAVVCAATPEPFHAVGLWYDDFSETSDEEVRALVQRASEQLLSAMDQPEEYIS
jgi:putative phosphoribosyl transferase